jgi:Flp pilus assembly pilin Flp
MRRISKRLAVGTRGAAAIEYGLIAALVAVAAIGAFQSLAAANVRSWDAMNAGLDEALK